MNKILVAIDGAQHSDKTLKSAAEMAKQKNSELVILYACSENAPSESQLNFAEKACGRQFRNLVTGLELPTFSVADKDGEKSISEYMKARAKLCELYGSDVLQRATETVKNAGADAVTTRMERGDIVKTILDVANKETADTIVIGNCHRNRVAQFFAGCTAKEVLKKANCTAVIVD